MTTRVDNSHSFSDDIAALSALDLSGPVTVETIETVLGVRAYGGIVIILIIPFLQPVPIPGVSVVFGIVIMSIGLRMLFGSRGGLPAFVRKKTIDGQTLKKILSGTRSVCNRLEKVVHPRLLWVNGSWPGKCLGLGVIIGGLALSLPLPSVVLFSNSLPALGLLCLAVGNMERDGALIVAGHLLVLTTWVYFYFIADLIFKIFN